MGSLLGSWSEFLVDKGIKPIEYLYETYRSKVDMPSLDLDGWHKAYWQVQGQVAETVAAPVAKSLVWRCADSGPITQKDLSDAKKYAKGLGYTMCVFDDRVAEPLEQARAIVLDLFSRGKIEAAS
jgi:hypothetical protein